MSHLSCLDRPLRRFILALVAIAALSSCTVAPQASSTPTPPALPTSPAQPTVADAGIEQRFATWIASFRDTARATGIDEATLRVAFDEVRYLPQVGERDHAQPEFTLTVWDYLDRAVTPQRIALGQEKLRQFRAEAEAVATRYGVPPPTLIAIWGIESNYGSHRGDTPTVDALATLGFDGRREDWARSELLAALKILQSGDKSRAQLVGSWAGAMGQTQFMPSSFLAYAVDADGDGRRDIWDSMDDILASTANLLARAGWRPEESWGVEVRLPAGFDLARADGTLRQTSAQWEAEGVQTVDATPLPPMADAAILLPAGARGPVFMVGVNFRAILRYNNSTSYALAVGLLAQQITGGTGVRAAWPRELAPLTRSQMQTLQAALNERGFDSGIPDGVIGARTAGAIRRYQRSIGLPPDGYPSIDLLERLQQQ
ncbi:MAG TPA: lytic murein transglycosylase [Burkholderiaceae bacterium]|nr:lytic murein transglycosylase [Burkholderiaceae bacterium]